MVNTWQDSTQHRPYSEVKNQVSFILQSTLFYIPYTYPLGRVSPQPEGKLLLYNILLFYIPYYQSPNIY